MEKIAVPIDNGVMSAHFGHAAVFILFTIDDGKVISQESLNPPPHEPGVIPRWLSQLGANKIITGGIGRSAVSIFNSLGVEVIDGAPAIEADKLIKSYLENTLKLGASTCNHDH